MACLSDFLPDAVVLVNEYMDILNRCYNRRAKNVKKNRYKLGETSEKE